jgi:GTP-binding protein
MDAKFLKSAAQPSDFPADRGRELAVVGRSNSGKSSAINAIFGHAGLARVSKTPGRTQLINFFEVGVERRIVDLPGYGFARVTPGVRERWRALIESYFERRRSLVGLILTVDIRRGLKPLDWQMLDWAESLGIAIVLLATKADKLSRSAAKTQLMAMEREVARSTENFEIAAFSAPQRQGVEWARATVEQLLEEPGSRRFPEKEVPGCGNQGTHPGSK